MGANSNYKNSSGVDLGQPLIDRSYLLDRYPELADTFKQAGLWLWGSNWSGGLGDNTTTNQSSPVQTVAGGTNWRSVAVGRQTVLAVKSDGTLWAWGNNFDQTGALGDNSTVNKSSPVQTVAGGTNWKQVTMSRGASYAIKTDGTLWVWGDNSRGRLGVNDNTHRSSPMQTISAGTNWKTLHTGGGMGTHTAAIKTDGTLWFWGDNTYGQLGDNTRTHRSSPIQTISGGTNWRQVTCGSYHTAAIKTDGTLWTWGYNAQGQLGLNDGTQRSSPVQIIGGGTNWRQVAAGSFHTAATKTDGTLWTWGRNANGELGDGTQNFQSSPVQTIAGGTNWRQVACGDLHTAAIKTDGTLWNWGANNLWQLGDTTNTNRSSPVQTISAGTNWRQVAAGEIFTAAIRDDSADPFGDSY